MSFASRLRSVAWTRSLRTSSRHQTTRLRSQNRPFTSLRRKRKVYEKFTNPENGTQLPVAGGLENPFKYSGGSLDEYTEKANLSPWTPVPDSVARKIFDRADPTEEDVHVELGSGDGRVNFFAINAGVKKSVGIDVDPEIVQVANDRLNRIHPKPNLHFLVADLMDPGHEAWEHVKEANILTMYFAKEGLTKLRPLLENALRGKSCKVFCCGYAMPGWESQIVETVLDMPIHFYDWGNADVEDAILSDRIIEDLPMDNMRLQQMDKFSKKKGSTFKPDPLLGFHPEDLVDYHWDDFDEMPVEDLSVKKGPE